MYEKNTGRFLLFAHNRVIENVLQSLLVACPSVGGDYIQVLRGFASQHKGVQFLAEESRVENVAYQSQAKESNDRFQIDAPIAVLNGDECGAGEQGEKVGAGADEQQHQQREDEQHQKMGPLFFEFDAEEETGDAGNGEHPAHLVLALVEHIVFRDVEIAGPIEAVEDTHHDEPQGVEITDVGPCLQVAVQGDSDANAQESDDELAEVCRSEPVTSKMEDDKLYEYDEYGEGEQPHKTGGEVFLNRKGEDGGYGHTPHDGVAEDIINLGQVNPRQIGGRHQHKGEV